MTNDAFDELDQQIQLGITATSRRVNKIREDYNAHTLYLTEKALILQAILDAIHEITCEEQRLTRHWQANQHQFADSQNQHGEHAELAFTCLLRHMQSFFVGANLKWQLQRH